MKYFDKNNWYIEEASLTDEQFVNVCKYLVESYKNSDAGFSRIECISKGDDRGRWTTWNVTGVVSGEYDVFDLPNSDLDDCTKITYEEFEQYLLNDSVQDDDGWISWNGGECPVEEGTLVDVVYRNGQVNHHAKAGETPSGGSLFGYGASYWGHKTGDYDIIKYRLHKPSEDSSESPDTNTPPNPEKPLESISERLVSIQKELLEVIGEMGCNITIYNDKITVNLGEYYSDKEFTWRDDRHSAEDLQKLLEGVKLIKEFEDK